MNKQLYNKFVLELSNQEYKGNLAETQKAVSEVVL